MQRAENANTDAQLMRCNSEVWRPLATLKALQIPHDLKEDTAGAPDVHLQAVVAVGEEALRGSVPARGDVLCVGGLRVHAPT